MVQCVERIRTRDASIHIPVSDDQIQRINTLAERVTLAWAAEIDNRGPLDVDAATARIAPLLER